MTIATRIALFLAAVLVYAVMVAPAGAKANKQAGVVRTLTGVKTDVTAKLYKSRTVVRFYNHKGRWALHPFYAKCWQVPNHTQRRVCMKARRNMRWHGARIVKLERRLQAVERKLYMARLSQIAINDWLTAVNFVDRTYYPGSKGWLVSCSSSEGRHGAWVPNTQGSGAGGWMQYMEGTFWSDYRAAVGDLTARGLTVPSSSASWSSPLGQAIAGGWAYFNNRPSGKWTGALC